MGKILGIYGAGGLGRETLEIARTINATDDRWKDIVFIVDRDAPDSVNGTPVFNYQPFVPEHAENLEVILAIGEPEMRKSIIQKLNVDSIKPATLIHPSVHIPNTTTIGEGVVICMGSFISCNASIGDNVLIQPHVNIGHDCVLGEGCIISSFCNIAGSVRIGSYTYLGLSTAVREGVTIGSHSIVGMSSSVVREIPDNVIALGNPARVMKNNDEGRVFKH